MKSRWLEMVEWAIRAQKRLPEEWPAELPAEDTPDFWFEASRLEMGTRRAVDGILAVLANGGAPPPISALEGWMIRRRFEWAAQLAMEKVNEGIEPDAELPEVLRWALIQTWESDGCIGFWNHAERGGKMHPKWGENWL